MSSSITITSPATANITDTSTSVSVSWANATTGTNWRVEGVLLVNGTVITTFNVAATASGTGTLAISANQNAIYNAATGSSLTGAITLRVNNYLDITPFTLYTVNKTGGTLTIARRLTSATNTTINPFNLDAFDGTTTYNFRAGWTRPHTAFRGRVSIYANGVLISTYSGFTTNISRTPSSAEISAMVSAMANVSPRNLHYVIETGFVANTTVYYTSGAITSPTSSLTKVFLSPSAISIGNFTLSSATTAVPFTLTVGTSGATHEVRLYVRVGGVDTLIRTQTGITASGNFTIGTTERNLILNAMPSSTTATTWAWVEASKDGNTAVSDSLGVATTVALDASYKPTLGTITWAEANAYMASITSSAYFLTSKSSITFTVPATMATGATRSSTRVQFAGTDGTTTGTGTTRTTGALQSAGTLSYTITVADSRGRSTAITAGSIIVRAYTPPTITNLSMNRVNSGNTALDPLGTRARATFAVEATTVKNASNAEVNHIRWVLEYRLRPSGSWTAYTSNTSNTTLTISTTSSTTGTFPITNAYDFRLRAYDCFYDTNNNGSLGDTDEYAESIAILPFGKVSLMIGEDRVAIGKVWTDGTLDVGGDIYSNGEKLSSETAILQKVFPVGSIYTSNSGTTNPSTILGFGTWSLLSAGTFPVAAGTGYAYGATGGATTHTHTIASHTHSTPDHTHSLSSNGRALVNVTGIGGSFVYLKGSSYTSWAPSDRVTASGYVGSTTSQAWAAWLSGDTDSGGASTTGGSGTLTTASGSNLPPYLAVFMWRRTA